MDKNWQAALGAMTYGIYVLTTRRDEAINGMIASWVTQVSHSPPLILAAVHPNRFSHDLMAENGAFGLHVIDRRRPDMLKRFKGPDPAKKFDALEWTDGHTGVPVLKDCLAWFELRIRERLTPGNHTLFIGEIVAAGVNQSGTPLSTLDYDGMYTGKN